MDTTVNAPPAPIPLKIGTVEFNYTFQESLDLQQERRVEALIAWLCSEWKKEECKGGEA